MIKNGELLEYAQFAAIITGRPQADPGKMEIGVDTVLDVEVNGYRQIK
jgi:guanylate kinase